MSILTGEIAVEVTGVVGVSPALWYFRYIHVVSICLTTQVPVLQHQGCVQQVPGLFAPIPFRPHLLIVL